jgi:KDO2-lipid IV(A) lauroyltransferase
MKPGKLLNNAPKPASVGLKPRKRRASGNTLTYRSMQMAVTAAGKLTDNMVLNLARVLGWLAPLAIYRWGITMRNLKLAFGSEGRSLAELRCLARSVFANAALTVLEVARTKSKPVLLPDDHFTISGLDHFQQAAECKKGIILFAGHLGNWEVAGSWFNRRMHPSTGLARLQSNPASNRILMELRWRLGLEILPNKCPWKLIRSFLAENYAMAFLADQHGGYSGTRVTFFGVPTTAPKGPILCALRTGAPVIPAFTVRCSDNPFHHKICFEPALQLVRTGNLEHDIQVNTQVALNVVETYIRRYPDQWWWMHRRWR